MPKGEHRINEEIRVRKVMLVDDEGGRRGEVATEDARRMAEEKGLDLVEVAPQSNPPVCKIMDYGKFKYEQKKKSQGARKKHHVSHIKEVRLRPLTEEHDMMIKLQHARSWIEHGDKVLVTMSFRGREMAHTEIGYERMKKLMETFDDIAKVESPMRRDGSRLTLTLIAKPGVVEKKEKERQRAAKEAERTGKAVAEPVLPPMPEDEPEEEDVQAEGTPPAAPPPTDNPV